VNDVGLVIIQLRERNSLNVINNNDDKDCHSNSLASNFSLHTFTEGSQGTFKVIKIRKKNILISSYYHS